ncbi:uncharacterized protein LACBIDRAFT_299130 [Laccaria bicolor S238N-H82]|uniref:Predicted protein n=1 Tax=Laccaria bicolor (strain S238N-H82 / ATCC MYA-4686) TaxID=486041 RepID=B0DE47_LACBS|nr:uncharacterized protein LACBIDRAFT_299130 [Laccaria bicolor S238N-H82]EDR07324.1 predicted protein [Laccaria bicolor S238N-H82]|eukprot:XP_001882255.1 predicted protein [Laccaria bicolor S238N-H82]
MKHSKTKHTPLRRKTTSQSSFSALLPHRTTRSILPAPLRPIYAFAEWSGVPNEI